MLKDNMSLSAGLIRVSGYRIQKREESARIGAYKLAGLLPKDYKQEEISYIPSLRDCLIALKGQVNETIKKSKLKTVENKL